MLLSEKYKLLLVYTLSLAFIVINSLLIVRDIYWATLIPLALLALYYFIFRLDIILMLVVLATPLAINLNDKGFGIGVSLPTEPLLVGVLIIYIIKLFHERGVDSKIIKHPVTLAVLFNLTWMLITCITSTLPLVSIKFFAARLWFVIPFYFLGIELFKNYKNIKRFSWLYIIPLTIVIFYTISLHGKYGFEEEPAHWVMTPFYNDHTAYGAILAMFYPLLIVFVVNRKELYSVRFISTLLFLIFTLAIVLSYTRAAWLSLVFAFAVFLIYFFKIKLRTLIVAGVALLVSILLFGQQVLMKLEKNRQDSSDDFAEHVQSISNISSDASNLERLNRWNSAFRMFADKPVFGFGPGTYMFKYAPYQKSEDRTIISTNSGDGGNAHSEYIGPLAESGILGALSFLTIIITVTFTASRLYYNAKTKEIRLLTMGIFLGLVTYFIHGGLNNFLDTDKASVPFWGFIAALVAMDLYHNNTNSKENLEELTAQ